FLRGARARWLGLLCMANIPAAFMLGLTWAILTELGITTMDDGPVRAAEFGLVILNLFALFWVGNKLFERQQREDLGEPEVIPDVADPGYSVVDPDNTFAAPSRKS